MEIKQVKLDRETWQQTAGLAYAGYMFKGHGAILIDVLPLISRVPGGPAPAGVYLPVEELKAQDWMTPEALAAFPSYDPETQIVIIGRALNGDLIYHTASTDGDATPRKLYDQLRQKVIGV